MLRSDFMLLSNFVLEWIYSLPVEQQGPTTIILILFCLELLIGCFQISLIKQWEKSIRGY